MPAPPVLLLLGLAACVWGPSLAEAAAVQSFESETIQIFTLPLNLPEQTESVTSGNKKRKKDREEQLQQESQTPTDTMAAMEDQEALKRLRQILVNLLNDLPQLETKKSGKNRSSLKRTTTTTTTKTTRKKPITELNTILATSIATIMDNTPVLSVDTFFNLDMEPFQHTNGESEPSGTEDKHTDLQNFEKTYTDIENAPSYSLPNPEDISNSFQETETFPARTRAGSRSAKPKNKTQNDNLEEFNKLMAFLEKYFPDIKSLVEKSTDMNATEEAFATLAVLKNFLYPRNPEMKESTREALNKILEDEAKVLELLLENNS
ncbi:hypothetical protein FKM82_004845 [Ascaphus truei]